MNVDDKIIALVALKDPTRIDPNQVAERVKAMFPWIANDIGVPVRQGNELAGFVIPIGGDTIVAVVPVHQPIPKETVMGTR